MTTKTSLEFQELESKWGGFLFLGIVLVVSGALALAIPMLTTLASVMFYGSLLLVSGIFELVGVFWTKGWNILFHLVGGILSVVVGGLIALYPGAGALGLTLMLAVLFLVGGFFRIAAGVAVRLPYWGWTVAGGVVSVLLGILIFREWPFSALWVVGTFVAIELLMRGSSWVMFAFALRQASKPHESMHSGTMAHAT
jgi:uncharacterized membrane protein HdeD (DUF308 family)